MTWKISIKWNAQRCFKFSSVHPPSIFVNFARLSVSKFVGFAQFGTFVQFKNREKYSWRSVSHSKLKVTLLHWPFPRFLNCKNDAKSRKLSQLISFIVFFSISMQPCYFNSFYVTCLPESIKK